MSNMENIRSRFDKIRISHTFHILAYYQLIINNVYVRIKVEIATLYATVKNGEYNDYDLSGS